MDRISAYGFVTDANGRRRFVDEDDPGGVDGTDVDAVWLTGVQEEIIGASEDAGLVPDDTDNTLLRQTISIVGRRKVVFTAPGTFTVPPGVYRIAARGWGAGGGGGGTFGASTIGGGGGGGGYAEGCLQVTPHQTIAIEVGTGGLSGQSGNPGGDGGDSAVGAFLVAGGGKGGGGTSTSGLSGTGGQPGSATAGAVLLSGYPGGPGYPAGNTEVGGTGGGTAMGASSLTANVSNATTAQSGADGNFPGGGANGGVSGGGGGSGANGLVILDY